ncbi:choline dehydrogenase [Massilia sp. WF1]|uniref:GMC family oxidoreductase n=1 Tax=unclassified Massilia TaxID=2609279 RepID=UPI00064AC293|nr:MULTISPECIES: GMC family oxidoreductase [unclassified Massilia]ALK96592.1 choline dehydrogenase [Massilia sp. WG5]KLU36239.1 choline dehydrogenase [Massilia sp. WF1]
MARRPRTGGGRAPDVFARGGWVPMREYPDSDEVDFAIVGAGAGGATLACKLAEAGFSVVVLEAGPFWRPLEDFASDEEAQQELYWLEERLTGGLDPIALGGNNSGWGVGGSTVHFSMISLRFRPEWFRARSLLGYGVDWPIGYDELAPYYEEAERALAISGPLRYPWGPPHRRYPYREHEMNAAGLVLARGAERMGVAWSPVPLATVSAPRGKSPPCVYRGFCNFGCSTNAKQSALVVWIPRALRAGAEVRDLAMAGRIELDAAGLASGVHYRRDEEWRFQRARNVVVAGYAIETPRLLLNSACARFPQGLANSSGLVGTHLTTHAGPGVWARFDEEIRWNKGPPNMAVCEHWNYADEGKDFDGGYAFMSQGPLPRAWAQLVATSQNLWGMALREAMLDYNHMSGLVAVAETEPRIQNRVTLAAKRDRHGLPVARVDFAYSDNDRRMQEHARRFMGRMLEAAGGRDLWSSEDTSHILGTCRMGASPDSSVVDADGRSWDVRNLWICDGSLFPTCGGVNPSLTIQALACRIGERIRRLSARGEL